MQGHFKFYQKCLAQKIKPILGIKFFVQDHSFSKEKILVAVIARNYTGLKQLFALSFFLLESNLLLTIDLEQLFNFHYAHCILVVVPQPINEKLFQRV